MNRARDEHRTRPARRSGAPKRPYEPPRILHEETVEVMAAACGGTPGGKNDPTCLVGFS